MEERVEISFMSVSKVNEVNWEDISGSNFYATGHWDNTVILYSKEYTHAQMKMLMDRIEENCLIDGKDWEDYELEDFEHPTYEFKLSAITVRLIWC